MAISEPLPAPAELTAHALHRLRQRPLFLERTAAGLALRDEPPAADQLAGCVPVLLPGQLGHAGFLREHGLRYPYVACAMAGGISSPELVVAMAQAGMLGFFGSGGLDPDRIERAIVAMVAALPGRENFGVNLLHLPTRPQQEWALVELFQRLGVRRVSASAFMDITLPLVYFRVRGLQQDGDGRVRPRNHLFAKGSRIDLLRKFMAPPPAAMVAELLRQGWISATEAELAAHIPLAQEITVEGDSGGHTDKLPTHALLAAAQAVRAELARSQPTAADIRIGAAGGIGTPESAAAALMAGADYLVTGSINQAAREAATSDLVKQLLAEVDVHQVAEAPAADMFELGAKVQVVRHRTLYPARARKLQQLYERYSAWEAIPPEEREEIEHYYFRVPFTAVWAEVESYFSQREPAQLTKAQHNPRQRMALAFRWYLGRSSQWAQQGVAERSTDFQIWCGAIMGAFNHWTRGSFLEAPAERRVVPMALNILYGACALLRARWLAAQGLPLPPAAFEFKPLPPAQLEAGAP